MTFQETIGYLRRNGAEIGRLAKQKDKLAGAVYHAYKRLYADRLNPRLQNELMTVVNEYAKRGLLTSELDDLERRYGVDHPGKRVIDLSRH